MVDAVIGLYSEEGKRACGEVSDKEIFILSIG